MITLLTVREPIWKPTPRVGISEVRMRTGLLHLYILYRNRAGERLYPNPLQITREKALTYPVEYHGDQVLHIIPIAVFTEIIPKTNP